MAAATPGGVRPFPLAAKVRCAPAKRMSCLGFTSGVSRAHWRGFMTSDQFWSIFAMPIGLLMCAGPMVIAWLIAEFRAPARNRKKNGR